jgi:hypothetical protein
MMPMLIIWLPPDSRRSSSPAVDPWLASCPRRTEVDLAGALRMQELARSGGERGRQKDSDQYHLRCFASVTHYFTGGIQI